MSFTDKIADIFAAPFHSQQHEMSEGSSRQFAYYTTAETAHKILSNEEIWLRNAALMNDFSEIRYGLNLISKSFGQHSKFYSKISILSERFKEDLFHDFAKNFDDWVSDLESNTYLACISKHCESENDFGRLSMWRAYGGRNGVALIIDASPMLTEEDLLKVYSVPVLYWSEKEAEEKFEHFVSELDAFWESVSPENWDEFKSTLAFSLRLYAISLKHPGFKEEQEWRIYYRPLENASEFVERSTQIIDGIPQIVYKLKLSANAKVSVNEIIRRVIIGPSEHQFQVGNALSIDLAEKGLDAPWGIIRISSIPLRN